MRRGYRPRTRRLGLDRDHHILGHKVAAVTRTRTAEVEGGEHHLGFRLTIHSIDYIVHLIHAVGTLHLKGGNRHVLAVTFQMKECYSRFEDYNQQ